MKGLLIAGLWVLTVNWGCGKINDRSWELPFPYDLEPWNAVVQYEWEVFKILCWDQVIISTTNEQWETRIMYTLVPEKLWNGVISEQLWTDGDISLIKENTYTPVISEALRICREKWTDAWFI